MCLVVVDDGATSLESNFGCFKPFKIMLPVPTNTSSVLGDRSVIRAYMSICPIKNKRRTY